MMIELNITITPNKIMLNRIVNQKGALASQNTEPALG